jgi:glutaminyl-tRNA synthetase
VTNPKTPKKQNSSPDNATSSDAPVTNFIRAIIDADLAENKNEGRVVTRFPPEPNGYLHIGHAKTICLNFGLARDYDQGQCNLRFDDTNPLKEEAEYVASIEEDVRWLGFDWGDNLFFASDYFERLYAFAVELIENNKAYVCDLNEQDVRSYRGTVTKAGRPSPGRERSIEENLDLFARMRAGEFEDGSHVLRARIDMSAANMKMRDPPLYRIRHAHHHRTGDEWCIYPMYDFTHGLSDSIEGVTHSLCTLEFENNRELYDWFLDNLKVPSRPQQIEFARLALSYTMMSKRKLLKLVEAGHVSGWDDPRMPTIAGLRRRGYTPEAIRTFCDTIGIARANNMVELAQLEFVIRNDLNTKTARAMAVLDPIKLVIDNYPQDQEDVFHAPHFPDDPPRMPHRDVPFTKELYIERTDFMEEAPRKYFRLAPGREVRLRWAYLVTCTGCVKNDAGEIIEVHCTYDPESRGGSPADGRKVKGTIHWVSAPHAVAAEVRLYDKLFQSENPGELDDDAWVADLNPESCVSMPNALVEPALAETQPGDRYQFERTGYFIADESDCTPDRLVFNRTVPLRDSWAKIKKKQKG